MRTFYISDIYAAADLGNTWFEYKSDKRITRTLASIAQRAGDISKPLGLLDSLSELDEAQALAYKKLVSQKKLLLKPFRFSKKAKRSYTPYKKRIIYNVSRSLPHHTSGYATRTHGLIKGLHQYEWDVQVVSRKGYPADSGIILKENNQTIIDGLTYTCDTSTEVGQHTTPLDIYIDQSAKYLVKQAKHMRPLLIHAASNYICGMAGIEAARRVGVPSIYEMRGLWHVTRASKEPLYEYTEQFALAQKLELETACAADHVLAITEELKKWLIGHGIKENKITVAPNAVNLEEFIICEHDEEYADSLGCRNKIVIGYIGSFVQYEGLDLLIEAVAMLPNHIKEKVVLLWVGDGPVLKELIQMSNELGISSNMRVLGKKPFSTIPKLYRLVDICAFPRKGQPVCEIISPLKPFEAMAMSKAIIVSDVGPLREIIDHGRTGLIHSKDNPESLSQTLLQFINNEDLRINCGREARRWVEETRSWGAIAKTVSNLYEKILS